MNFCFTFLLFIGILFLFIKIIESGKKYTVSWWAERLNLNKQVAFARLRRSELVEKIKVDGNKVVKFIPKEKSVEEILKELK